MAGKVIESLESIRQRFSPPRDTNKIHRSKLGLQDRIALLITGAIGTMYAVYIFALFIALWMLWQSRLDPHPFDPFPFVFLLFLGNIVQLLLMPLIMVGQNIQGKHAELRSQHDFETDQKAEKEIEAILEHLEKQDRMLQQILDSRSGV